MPRSRGVPSVDLGIATWSGPEESRRNAPRLSWPEWVGRRVMSTTDEDLKASRHARYVKSGVSMSKSHRMRLIFAWTTSSHTVPRCTPETTTAARWRQRPAAPARRRRRWLIDVVAVRPKGYGAGSASGGSVDRQRAAAAYRSKWCAEPATAIGSSAISSAADRADVS